MKKKNTSLPQTDLGKIEKLLQDLEHNQKVSDQKNADSFSDLRFKIMAESAKIRQEFETTTRAEIQVATSDLGIRLEKELHEVEKRLNRRITDVSDLITIYFGKKIKVLDKRVTHLEHVQQAA